MKPLQIVSGCLALAALICGVLAVSDAVPMRWHGLMALGASLSTVVVANLPRLFGDAAVTLPQTVVDVARKAGVGVLILLAMGASGCSKLEVFGRTALGACVALVVVLAFTVVGHLRGLAVVLLLLAAPASAQHGPRLLLDPHGAGWQAVQLPPAVDPGMVLVADAGPTRVTTGAPLVATAPVEAPAPSPASPSVIGAPGVVTPPGAANITAPVVADCTRCAQGVAGIVAPGKPWPWWGTLLITLGASLAATVDHYLMATVRP